MRITKIYLAGHYESGDVFVNRTHLKAAKSQKVINHSPTGFAWGYGGSGPAQLALAILLACCPKDVAIRNYQRFKREVIAGLPKANFEKDLDISDYTI
jgi:hypothetical protein